MEFIGAIITTGRFIVGMVYPPIKRKYFDQPKVHFQFKRGSCSYFRGQKDDDNVSFDVVREYSLVWNYTMILWNNSDFIARRIELINPAPDKEFELKSEINFLEALQPNKPIEYKVVFRAIFKGTGKMAEDEIGQLPNTLRSNCFILEYTNDKETSFYTKFDATADKLLRNQFSKYFPGK